MGLRPNGDRANAPTSSVVVVIAALVALALLGSSLVWAAARRASIRIAGTQANVFADTRTLGGGFVEFSCASPTPGPVPTTAPAKPGQWTPTSWAEPRRL